MAIFSRKNLLISVQGPDSLLINPTSNGEILFFDAKLGSFIPPFGTGDNTQGINQGTGVPVFDNQVDQDLFFNTLKEGNFITITESGGEITISSTPATTLLVPTIAARDALTGVTSGTQVFVQDTGQGEHAMYLWTGSEYITISTEDSAATDAQTLAATVVHSSPTKTLLGRVSPGSKVVEVIVDVITPFNGSAPTLSIGDIVNGIGVVMNETANDLTVSDKYTLKTSFLYTGTLETEIKIFLDADGSSDGRADVTVSYV